VIGEVLDGKYEILRLIGEGGMGAVYEAEHLGMGRRVAVKIILARDLQKKRAHIKRFHREARAAGSVDSRHIAQVLDTGTLEDGRPYMVMELLVGEDFGQLLRRIGPLAPEVATAVVAQACRGLAKAHEAGVIHRDLKPANVFLAERDGEIVVKLIDFGIAKFDVELDNFKDSTLTKTGSLLGSPLYMSPEQARGKREIDQRADLWSLGVVLYRSLCGRTPFQDVEALGDLIITICSSPVPPIQDVAPWVPPAIAEALHKALKLHPDARYQTASEMADALSAVVPTTTITPDQLMPLEEAQKARTAHRIEVSDEAPTFSTTSVGLAASQAKTSSNGRSRSLMLIASGALLAFGAVALYTWSEREGSLGAGSPETRGVGAVGSPTPPEGPQGGMAGAAPSSSPTAASSTPEGSASATDEGGAPAMSATSSSSARPPPAPPTPPPVQQPPSPPPSLPLPDDEEFGGRK